jgi:hypothetical protein
MYNRCISIKTGEEFLCIKRTELVFAYIDEVEALVYTIYDKNELFIEKLFKHEFYEKYKISSAIDNFKVFKDYDGSLLPIDFKELPFIPKRLFVVSDVPKGYVRGNHAHYETKQLLICLKGEILVHIDNGKYQEEHIIKENEYVLVNNLVWDFQKFLTGNDSLLVICSTEYDKNDYIEDVKKFKTIANGKL